MMRITCLVDNAVKEGSPFWGEHGLAFLLETPDGRALFDTGASGTVLMHNMALAGIEPSSLSAVALSHSHLDHSGGLPDLLERRPGLPLYGSPALFRERFSLRDGHATARGLPLTPEVRTRLGELCLNVEPQQVLPGVWTTGAITERNEPEGRSAAHVVRQGEGWAPDPYEDDLALLLETAGGVLVCGCCHAGLLNTLAHVKRTFGVDPATVIGGTHLITADAAQLAHLVDVLRPLGPPALYLNHCTGQTAFVALAQAFGSRVMPFPAGSVLDF